MSIKEVSDVDFFQEVFESDRLVLVDFYSELCPPCRVMAPEVEALAKDLEGKIHVIKVNVVNSPQVVGDLEIDTLPTVMLFKDGEAVDGVAGLMTRAQLHKFVSQHLHSGS